MGELNEIITRLLSRLVNQKVSPLSHYLLCENVLIIIYEKENNQLDNQ